MSIREVVVEAFRTKFCAEPSWVVRAPGRVNLIGDHTDYNEGFVLPMAIDRAVWIALRPRAGNTVRLHSLEFQELLELDLSNFRKERPTWKEYVKGVAWAYQDAGFECVGWEGVVGGDVPVASGLSSSAAFELALARAFTVASNLSWEPVKIARLMQKVENEWVGVASGIMDQLISAVAQAGKATLIDCRNLDLKQVALPPGIAVVILNTMKSRGLVHSAYNERRQQCAQAAAFFGARSLRDVRLDELLSAAGQLDETIYRRAGHVLSENQRVLDLALALEQNDPAAAGELMNLSHKSLRDDFEVSCKELDLMVAAAVGQPGCLGARMTGAGFGGCAVALVQDDSVDEFIHKVSSEYQQASGIEPELLVSNPAGGVELETLAGSNFHRNFPWLHQIK